MVLVDTSVWIAHFRAGSPGLLHLLENGRVAVHPFVVGELACGNLHRREEIIRLLNALPPCPAAGHEEVLHLIENRHLMGVGLGYVDVHLLASALINRVRLWTLDRRLDHAASQLGIAHKA
jgi:predicted nucleic acid-binding protein